MFERFLIDRDAADAATFAIRRGDGVIVELFRTGGVNGNTAAVTAVGNAADYSEHHEGRFDVLEFDEAETALLFEGARMLARVEGGTIYDNEEVAAA